MLITNFILFVKCDGKSSNLIISRTINIYNFNNNFRNQKRYFVSLIGFNLRLKWNETDSCVEKKKEIIEI